MLLAKPKNITNHTGLWDADLAWYSLYATHRICLHGLKHSQGIHRFKPTWLCLTDFRGSCNPSKISSTNWLLYCGQPCLHNKYFWLLPQRLGPVQIHEHKFQGLDMFICAAFKSYMGWSNVQRVSVPTTILLATTAWTALVTWYTRRKILRTTKIL